MVLFPVIRFLPKVHCSWRLSGKMINFSQYQSWNMTGNWTIVMNFSQEDFMFLINFHQLVRSLRHQSSQMHSQSALLFLHSLERVLSPPRQWTAMTILSFLLSHTSLFPSHRHNCSEDRQESYEIVSRFSFTSHFLADSFITSTKKGLDKCNFATIPCIGIYF